jgi:hypothetical protein
MSLGDARNGHVTESKTKLFGQEQEFREAVFEL